MGTGGIIYTFGDLLEPEYLPSILSSALYIGW